MLFFFWPSFNLPYFSKRVFFLHWSQPSPPNKRSEVRVTSFGQAMSLSGQYWNLKSRRRNSGGEQNQKWNIFLQKKHELVVKNYLKNLPLFNRGAFESFLNLKVALNQKLQENKPIFNVTLKIRYHMITPSFTGLNAFISYYNIVSLWKRSS